MIFYVGTELRRNKENNALSYYAGNVIIRKENFFERKDVEMNKKKNLDMTTGNPLNLLIVFTIPALASNLLNQVYSITDSIIVGRVLGPTALAAVGVCMPIVMLISAMIVGLNIGVGILLSQSFGRHDVDEMRHVFANSLYLGAIMGILAAVIGIPCTAPILRLMGTPAGPMPEAITYMRITFLASGFPVFYYLLSNAFRGMGDSYTSLYCLIVSVVSNIFLDYLFVARFRWGVAGSAYATAIAQGLSVTFAFYMLYQKYPEMRLKKSDLVPDLHLFAEITKLAVPIALQNGFNNLGNVVVQSCINGFGETIMASFTVASRLGTLALMPVETIAASLSVYSGQNYGAKKMDRIEEGVKAAHKMNAATSIVLAAVLILLGKPLTRLFLSDASDEILSAVSRYLLFAAVPGILYGIMHIYQQVLRGIGKANQSMIGSFIQLGAKVLVAVFGAFVLGRLNVVWFAWPFSYVVGILFPYWYYKKYMKKKF